MSDAAPTPATRRPADGLPNAEACLRMFADSAEDYAFILLDANGMVAKWNDGAGRLTGYRAEEILGRSVSGFHLPDDVRRGRPMAALEEAAGSGAFAETAWRLRKGGAAFWAQVRLSALRDAAGGLSGFAMVLRDLSERHQAEEALRLAAEERERRIAESAADLARSSAQAVGRLEERFHKVVEATPNAIVMIRVDGRIEMVNAQAERMFGYSRAELIGMLVERLVPRRMREGHPALREAFFAKPVTRAMGAGRDLYAVRKDGSEFPVEIGLNPIETDEGTMVLSAIVDISARRRLEERFRRVVEAAPNGMVMVGANGCIEMVNAQTERMFGYTRAELVGQRIEILVPERFRARHPGMCSGFFSNPVARPIGMGRDLSGLKKDGSEFPIEIGLNPIETDEGLMVLSSIMDITDRVYLEAQLRQAQKMEAVGRLTAGVAHDFNNLLQTMMGGLELLRDRVTADPTSNELLEMSIDAAHRGGRLTHHLLAFSRKQMLRPNLIDLAALLRRTATILERTLGPNIVLEKGDPAPGLRAFADSAQLESCILNLAINARDAMPRGGRLRIRAGEALVGPVEASETLPVGCYAVLTVEDSGTGMPPDVLERVFEPFFTTKSIGNGSGLGLPMVLGYARQSGGDVRIASTPGHGTRVDLYLPCTGPEETAARPVVAAEAARRQSGRILLVDDAADVLVTLGAFLDGAGFEVVKARSGDEALAIIAGPRALDAIITDYAMPDMSGAELLEQVAQIRPLLPALVVTGYPGVEGLAELPAGVQVLHKPFQRDEMLERLRRLLEEAATGEAVRQGPTTF